MKFKAAIALCKKAKQVILLEHKTVQWIADGCALTLEHEKTKAVEDDGQMSMAED